MEIINDTKKENNHALSFASFLFPSSPFTIKAKFPDFCHDQNNNGNKNNSNNTNNNDNGNNKNNILIIIVIRIILI